jgi:adenylate cyclase
MMAREEYNLPLNEKSYNHLLTKADGNIITKTRYYIPIHNGLTAELDIFEGKFTNMTLVEVEFSSIDKANSFNPPEWFGKDVTHDGRFHNSYLSQIDCCLGK